MDENRDHLNDEILFLLDEHIFVRWRIDYDFSNRSIYNRLFDRNSSRNLRDVRSRHLPEIKAKPNTAKLQNSAYYQNVLSASGNQSPARGTPLVHMLQTRERLGGGRWQTAQRRLVNNMFMPNRVARTLGSPSEDKKNKYCGIFSGDGRYLLVAGMDGNVTVFDALNSRYQELHKYYVSDYNHALLDIDISPNGQEFLCSSWTNFLYTCNLLDDDINHNYFKCHKLTNSYTRMGIFSACFSNDANELMAAANDGCFYVYDRNVERRTLRIVQDKNDDINAVRFLDRSNNNVIVGASNDGIVELWDRRTLSEKTPKSVGTLIGHFDGITYLDSKNDGRYFITNSKDQSIKLWDVRKMSKKSTVQKMRKYLSNHTWNYLTDIIPTDFYGDKKPIEGDCSLITYRGHRVCKTLIRSRFSPLESTGQRYIYSGCSTGRLIVYDSLTGKMVNKIDGHADVVRDVAWHPTRPEFITTSFDGKCNLNDVHRTMGETWSKRPPRRSMRIAKRARLTEGGGSVAANTAAADR